MCASSDWTFFALRALGFCRLGRSMERHGDPVQELQRLIAVSTYPLKWIITRLLIAKGCCLPIHTLSTDQVAPPLYSLFIIKLPGDLACYCSPSSTTLLQPLPSIHRRTSACGSARADTSLLVQEPTLLYPPTPSKPVETGLSLV